jgi:hypothetical protein
MKTLIKLTMLSLAIGMGGGLSGQTTLFTFNTSPTWTSSMALGTDPRFVIATGGATGSLSKYLAAKITSPGGGGIRVITVNVPKQSQVDISGFMQVPYSALPYSATFACKAGTFTAANFNENPASWLTVKSFSDAGINGNNNVWTSYDTSLFTDTNNVISLAFEFTANETMRIGFDQVMVDPLYALPVELIKFDARKENNNILLSWITASEANSMKFDIERSSDGTHFETIASQPAAGNSQSLLNYTYSENAGIDNNTLYYRLKEVDFNGKYSYSETRKVQNAIEETGHLKAYPNPFTDRINWRSTGKDQQRLVLQDLQGREVYAESIKGMQNGTFSPDKNLPQGIYILSIGKPGGETEKILLQH